MSIAEYNKNTTHKNEPSEDFSPKLILKFENHVEYKFKEKNMKNCDKHLVIFLIN